MNRTTTEYLDGKNLKYWCAKCGCKFESKDRPRTVGCDDLHEFKDGEPIPDILLFVCNKCAG